MKAREQSRRTCEAIIMELRKQGATDVEVVTRNKHPAVQFKVDGRPGFVTFTKTKTDPRAHYNQISFARRVCNQLRSGT